MTTSDQQYKITEIIREILGDTYTHLRVKRVSIEEDLESESTEVKCDVTDQGSDRPLAMSGKGVGVIDAFFHAVVDRYAAEYPSLKTISFQSFSVGAQMETRQHAAGTDSKGKVNLDIANSEGKVFTFTHASRSVIGSALITTLLAAEYFINSERAYITAYHAFKDAKQRNRQDLIQKYTSTMAVLVQNTSYSEVISKIREEIG